MRNFAFAIGVITGVGLICSYLLPITLLLQFQLLRVGVFMLYFGMLYLGHFLVQECQTKNLPVGAFVVLAVSYILLITPLIAVLLYPVCKALASSRFKPAWLLSIVGVLEVVSLSVSLQSNLWSPGFHIYGPQTDWRAAQEWATENTPVDAKFITPPHLFWHYVPDWRVFSERATVATAPELMEIPFNPAFEVNFRERFEAVAPGAMAQFNGNYMETLQITKAAFYANTTEDFIETGCRFGATYLVVERPYTYDLSLIYQNDGFQVYALPDCEQ